MSRCYLCGKEFDANTLHIAYAFVGAGMTDCEARELCPEHTEQFGKAIMEVRE